LLFVLLAWWLLKVRQPPAAAAKQPATPPAYEPRVFKTRSRSETYGQVVQLYEQALAQQVSAPRFRLLVMTHYNVQAYAAAAAASQRFREALPAEFAVADLVLHAHLHTCLGEPQRAVDLYTQLLTHEAPSAAVYNNRGYAYNMLAEYALALQDFNQALALQPTMAYAYNNRGLALHRLGMSAEGQSDIAHSLRLDSQNAYAYRNLGICHFDQGDYQAALPLFERAHRLGTEPPELAAYLTKTRQQLGLG
jgi:tetratricopeptide (TPR) repeat protein